MSEENELYHYGTKRHSGRYPWGSGDDPFQGASSFVNEIDKLHKQGLSEKEIAQGLGMTTTELRARKSNAKSYIKSEELAQVRRLKEKGVSNTAIAERIGRNESYVRALLKPEADAKIDKAQQLANALKEEVAKGGFIDYSLGVAGTLGSTETQMKTAVQMLKDEGYETHIVHIKQIGTKNFTNIRVLAEPGTDKKTVVTNLDKVRVPGVMINPDTDFKTGIKPPVSVDPKRVKVRYAEDHGKDMDGVIQIRRGAKDLDLGDSHYAQVRIAVGGTHYLKGMAIYADDLPKGVDIMFNTNKHKGTPMIGDGDNTVLKQMHPDPTNPFGAYIRKQTMYKDKDGKMKQSALNIVNDEGSWDGWSRTLSSQFLSKQPYETAKKQLELTKAKKQAEFDRIMSLTNPEVKKKLLGEFADSCDHDAVHLKAAAFPRQASQVILPMPSLKPNEVYAPNYKHGERVVLVRYPHAGTFELPELVVNNRHKLSRELLGPNIRDAVAINPKVAERLSGADFDGDSVVVIPRTSSVNIKTRPSLSGLIGFEPKDRYAYHEGMKVMSKGSTGRKMGEISNLITDMTLKGADEDELARAVRHSMVVIDAAKHKLDYQQSFIDNDIDTLQRKYQSKSDGSYGGASTLISRAKSDTRVPEQKLRSAREGGPIDPKTGKYVYVKTGRKYIETTKRKDGTVVKKEVESKTLTKKLLAVESAHELVSVTNTPMERLYADHSDALRSLANEARKAKVNTPSIKRDPEAAAKYSTEVASLKNKLAIANANKPRERQAQVIANATSKMMQDKYPDLEKKEIQKIEQMAIATARIRTGASRRESQIDIEPKEWEAIQKGAISSNMLNDIMANTNTDKVTELALPRQSTGLSKTQIARVNALKRNNATNAEIADALGVSVGTIQDVLYGGDKE